MKSAPKHRVVLDTNVYISGIFWDGKPRSIIHMAKQEKMSVIVSDSIIEEIEQILKRPNKPFRLNQKEITKIVENIRSYAITINPSTRLDVIKHDPNDNHILECAVEGNAEFIISGDLHLKELNTYQGIRIISPDEYMKVFSQ